MYYNRSLQFLLGTVILITWTVSMIHALPSEGQWYEKTTFGDAPTNLGGHSVASDHHNDWVFGGYQEALKPGQSNVYFNSIYRFHRRSGFWSQVDPFFSGADRPAPRALHNSFKHGRYVYVFGGVRYGPNFSPGLPAIDAIYNDVWKFDTLFRSWHRMASPSNQPSPRAAAAGEFIDGKFYLFGGVNENYETLDDTWMYDPNHNQWTEITPGVSPSARQAITSATDGEVMTIFGGNSLDASGNFHIFEDIWQFDPNVNEWTQIPVNTPLPNKLTGGKMVAYKQRLYLHGGFIPDNDITSKDPLGDTNKFDLDTQSFTSEPEGPHLNRHTLSLVGREMCAIGGYDYDLDNDVRMWNNKVHCFIVPECGC